MEEDEDFDLLKGDVMIDNIDGSQAVSFSSKVIKLMEKIMDKAIVTKLLGVQKASDNHFSTKLNILELDLKAELEEVLDQ
ncbi:hypothetical protein Goshw_021374 [Gossypium schwendimanii]|uniref:Uncharacterized protein n=1 Tax=Gossypium schwendimanii TaxID=34291 RepID=A0A7J9NE27_GOSSC|nr:hypothetical protein [Gossypium schwendimanii]